MTLREEYEALASIVAATKGTPAWEAMDQCAMLDAALSLCLRAVDEAESKEAECVAWNEAANGYDAEIASLLADIARLRAEVERLQAVHEAELGVCEQHCNVVHALSAENEALRSHRAGDAEYHAEGAGRLRAELSDTRQLYYEVVEQRNRLRSRLAEAEALLRDGMSVEGCNDVDTWAEPPCGDCFTCRARAFLAQTRSGESASKEDSDASA